MSKNDLRRTGRLPHLGPVRLSWTDDHGEPRYIQAKCLDYSEAGLRVESSESIPIRSSVSLQADQLKLAGSATVKHVSRRGGKIVMGLSFNQAIRSKRPVAV